ncbi:MAG TPA: hypothetical protein VMZ91_13560 [Candidatus Paceibacterota bacterium]|nr:hypothetical protein [Candidatus Paceibacterota bacterium]
MPLYFNCPICRLSLPSSVAVSIIAIINGKKNRLTICENCRKIKEKEGLSKKDKDGG